MHSSSRAPGLIYSTNNSFGSLEALISCQSLPLFIFALICCCIYSFHLYVPVSSHVLPLLSSPVSLTIHAFLSLPLPVSCVWCCPAPWCAVTPPTYLPTHPSPHCLGGLLPQLCHLDPGECGQLCSFITCTLNLRTLDINVFLFACSQICYIGCSLVISVLIAFILVTSGIKIKCAWQFWHRKEVESPWE